MASSFCAPAAHAAVLIDDAFDNPTEITYSYPSPEGTNPIYHGMFSGWTRQGSISVTYGAGLGTNGSGGMLCIVDQPSDIFMFFMMNDIVLPITDPSYTTTEQIRSFVASFDVRVPAGKSLDVALILKSSDPTLKARTDASKLTLGRVTGTGEYARHTLSAESAPEQSVRAFLQLLRDLSLNESGSSLKMDLRWTLRGQKGEWLQGETIQVDNVRLDFGK